MDCEAWMGSRMSQAQKLQVAAASPNIMVVVVAVFTKKLSTIK